MVDAKAYLLSQTFNITSPDSWLHIVDVSDPSAPALLGSFDVPGIAEEVGVVSSNLMGTPEITAYVADGRGGLHIVDVSDPAAASLVATVDDQWRASHVAVANGLAYVASEGRGVHIVDVGDPATASVLASYERPTSVIDLDTEGTYGYIISADKLWVADLANPNPATPSFLGTHRLQRGPRHLVASDSRVYVVEPAHGVEIFDVSDSQNPVLAGEYAAPPASEVSDIYVNGQYGYVSAARWIGGGRSLTAC